MRWPRGYDPPRDLRRRAKAWHAPRTALTVATACTDHALILALGYAAFLAVLHLPAWAAAPILLAAWLAIARFQRGLENLVHEGSHYNWTRRKKLNDRLVDLLAALPTFSRVDRYRLSHYRHHRCFGGEQDADLQRYRRLRVERLDRRRPLAFAAGLARRLLPYVVGWWRASLRTDPGTLVRAVLWHLVVLVLPAVLLLGPRRGVLAWLLTWPLPFFLVLPWHRFVAEAAKHQYEGQGDMFAATLSNIGTVHRWWLHPHNDGYHLLHHLFPGVPHHCLAAAHREMLAADPEGYGRFRHRLHVLEDPQGA